MEEERRFPSRETTSRLLPMAIINHRYKMKKLRQLQRVAIKFLVKLRYQHLARQAVYIQAWVRMGKWRRWWLMTSHRLELCRRFAKVVKIILVGACLKDHVQKKSGVRLQTALRCWYWYGLNKKRKAARSIQTSSRKRQATKKVQSVRIRKNMASTAISRFFRMVKQRQIFLRVMKLLRLFQTYIRWRSVWRKLKAKKLAERRLAASIALQRCWTTIQQKKRLQQWSLQLHAAISWGNVDAVRDLVQCKDPEYKGLRWMDSKINIRDASVGYKTFMQTAVACEPVNVACVQVLSNDAGFSPDSVDAGGNSLLHACAQSGDRALVALKIISNRLLADIRGSMTLENTMKRLKDITAAEGGVLVEKGPIKDDDDDDDDDDDESLLAVKIDSAESLLVESDCDNETEEEIHMHEDQLDEAESDRYAMEAAKIFDKFLASDFRSSIGGFFGSLVGSSAEEGLHLEAFKIAVQETHVAASKMRMSEQDLVNAFNVADTNADGLVDKDEFLAFYPGLQVIIRRSRRKRCEIKRERTIRDAEATAMKKRKKVERRRLSNLTEVKFAGGVRSMIGGFSSGSEEHFSKMQKFINRMNKVQDTALDVALDHGAGRTASFLLSMGCTSYHIENKLDLEATVKKAREHSEAASALAQQPSFETRIEDDGSLASNPHFHFLAMERTASNVNNTTQGRPTFVSKFTPSAKKRRDAYRHNVNIRKSAEENGKSLGKALKMYASEEASMKQAKTLEKAAKELEKSVAVMLRRVAAYKRNKLTAHQYRGWYYKEGASTVVDQAEVRGPLLSSAMKSKLETGEIRLQTLVCFGEPRLWFEVRHLFPPRNGVAFELEEKHYKRDLALLDSYMRYAGSSEDSSSSGSGLILF